MSWRNDATLIHSRTDEDGNPTTTAVMPYPLKSLHGGATVATVSTFPNPHWGAARLQGNDSATTQGGGQSCCEGVEAQRGTTTTVTTTMIAATTRGHRTMLLPPAEIAFGRRTTTTLTMTTTTIRVCAWIIGTKRGKREDMGGK